MKKKDYSYTKKGTDNGWVKSRGAYDWKITKGLPGYAKNFCHVV